MTFKSGETIYISKQKVPIHLLPDLITRGFAVGDSIVYMISEKRYLEGIFYRMKAKELEKQLNLYKQANENLLRQKELYISHMNTEASTNDKFIEQLKIKDKIIDDAILALKKRNWSTKLYIFALGLIAGYLWSDGQE